jgi:aminoglycoside/choline kinase family phosphotransferase
MDQRLSALARWVDQLPVAVDQPIAKEDFVPVSDDASFRRYFRCTKLSESWVFMDAPPEKEPLTDFLRIGRALADAGQAVPRILAEEAALGFLALTDLGDRQLLSELRVESARADALRVQAVDQLASLVTVNCDVPTYSEAKLIEELWLFPDWYLSQYLGLDLSENFSELWVRVCEFLVDSALAQPQGFVHRDYHSRNLMVIQDGNLGLLDFQDAVVGPVSYDLVSLLRDCYVECDAELETELVKRHHKALSAFLSDLGDLQTYRKRYELMGLQRHLKCAGIFARLYLRDGKEGYLQDIPRVLRYIMDVLNKYSELEGFANWLGPKLPADVLEIAL